MLNSEGTERGEGIDVHLSFAAALAFEEQSGHWPRLHHNADAQAVLALAKKISEARKATEGACWAQAINWGFPSGEAREVDATRVLRFAKLFATELTGFCAYLGGVTAQEVLKKTGKYEPIDQWLHHDDQVPGSPHVTVLAEPRQQGGPWLSYRDHHCRVVAHFLFFALAGPGG